MAVDKIRGYIRGIPMYTIYESERGNFTIIKLKITETNENYVENEIVIKGNFKQHIEKNIEYIFYGHLVDHPRFGIQYEINSYETYIPETKEGMIRYLSSDLFYGIGPKTASRIVERLGKNAIQKILQDPLVIQDIPGLSKQRRESFVKRLKTYQGFEQIAVQLSRFGISLDLTDALYETYGEETLTLLKTDPYQFVFEIERFSFRLAEVIAAYYQLQTKETSRIGAGVYDLLQQAAQDGHVFLPKDQCVKQIQTLLHPEEMNQEYIDNCLKKLSENQKLVVKKDRIYLPALYYVETEFIQHLKRLLAEEIDDQILPAELMKIVGEIEKEEAFTYGEEQFEAIYKALQSKIMVLTGGPGTGKTTVIKGILHAYASIHNIPYHVEEYEDLEDYPFILTAPTGRAAKRLSESTQLPAVTIHRLLGWDGEDYFEKNEQNQLQGKYLVVDEVSMVDIRLAYHLFKAIPNDMQILLVGDEDQLPSVGPGQVLYDILQTDFIPFVNLEEVYRQAEGSKIIHLAHHIKRNTCTIEHLQRDKDFSFISCSDDKVVDAIIKIIEKAKKKQIDLQNIQVIAPMYRTPVGIDALNKHLQALINPKASTKKELRRNDVIFREGDRVIQLVNQPDDDVYNGDIGEITSITTKENSSQETEEITVSFGENQVTYQPNHYHHFMHAYCISIHKAQGSEFPIVILPIVRSYQRMLKKNLLYTAITRGKHSLILCGNKKAFLQGVQDTNTNNRYTTLAEKLKKEISVSQKELTPYDFMD